MGTVILSAVAIALWIGAANKGIQLWRAPEDLPLRAVTACIGCAAVMFSLGLPPVRAVLDQAGVGLRILAVNLGTMIVAYLLLAFFRYSVHGPSARRGVRLQAVPLAGAMIVAVGSWYLAPADVRSAPADPANGTDIHATVFVLAVLGYMAYAHVQTLRWSTAYARAATLARLRRGLAIICVAISALLSADLTKAALAVAQLLATISESAVQVLNSAYLVFVGFGTFSFVVGISYPAVAGMVAAVPVWRTHRRYYRELRPLWAAMYQEFPDLALARRPSTRWRDLFGIRGTHRRFYRRVIEIRDGLVQLAPYYDPAAARQVATEDRSSGHAEMAIEDTVQASLIANALRSKATGAPITDADPVPISGGHDLDSDAQWLVRIAGRITPFLSTPSTDASMNRPPGSGSIAAAP